MSSTLNVTAALITVLSGTVATLATLAWRRARTTKSGLLAGAFVVFFLKAAYVTWALFTTTDPADLVMPVLVMDAAILLVLYAAIVKR